MSSQRFRRVLRRILRRTIVSDVMQGVIGGGGLAIVTARVLMNAYGLAKQIQLAPLSQKLIK